MTRLEAINIYEQVLLKDKYAMCELGKTDLFFMLVYILKRDDANNDFVFDRCREVQDSPNGHLDLWSRFHYKSSIITTALTIQDIINDKEARFCIFSHTRPIAKGFLRQIKREFEDNQLLKLLYPDVLYDNPKKDSPKWSEDEGITVRRQGNPKECTVEAWGLVDGQPTSKHFTHIIYDDVVIDKSVTTPEMIKKTTDAWGLSQSLVELEQEGSPATIQRHIGTRYHFNDTYRTLIRREVVKPRIYPGTKNGKPDGEPVMMTQNQVDDMRKSMGSYLFSCQVLQNPVADSSQGFKREWMSYYNTLDQKALNLYICVDPANDKKKKSDYTVISVIGLGSDNNYYLVDMIRDRFNLKERTDKLIEIHRKYKPLSVAYEEYGMQCDIAHIEGEQEHQTYRFRITPVGGNTSKEDRIKTVLVPLFENHRFYFPKKLMYTQLDGRVVDLVDIFIEDEFTCFPVSIHDDMLDCIARIESKEFLTITPALTNQLKDIREQNACI